MILKALRSARMKSNNDVKLLKNIESQKHDDGMAKMRLRTLHVAIALAFGSAKTYASPFDGEFVAGAGAISAANHLTTIRQDTQRAIVNWQSFSTNIDETVRFIQPNVDAAILNRVVGNLPSQLNGVLEGNGRVYLINQNGIMLGKDGVINVHGGFVATTQGISDSNFMQSGALLFTGESVGNIQILGKISAPGGDIVVIAPKTEIGTSAVLQAGDKVQLIAASEVQLTNGKLTVTPKTADAGQITMAGAVHATQVQLATHHNNLGALAINTSGTIRATGTQANPDGSVTIFASGVGSNIKISGTINAENYDSNKQGGSIIIGRDAETSALSQSTDVSGATLNTNKGFIETSAHELKVDGVKVSAANWLLDPDNIDITGDATTATAGYSKIKASDVQTALNNGTNVTIATTAANRVSQPAYVGSAATGLGDILISAPIDKSTGSATASLSLKADRDITINSGITNSGGGQLLLNFSAGRHINASADIDTKGGITLMAGTAGAGGNITLNNLLKSTSYLNVQAANGAWTSGKGQITFGANGKVSGVVGFVLYSGLAYNDATGVIGTTRTSFDDSVHVDSAAIQTSAGGNLSILGFDTLNISKAITANTINILAKNITINNAALTSSSWLSINAGGYSNASGVYSNTGWQAQTGQLSITGTSLLSYAAGSYLTLTSGIGNPLTGARATLDDINITWAGAGTGPIYLQGFDKITTTKAIVGGTFDWKAKDITVGANITSSDAVYLRAAAFDQSAAATIKGAYLGGDEGYKTTLGQLTLASNAKVTYVNDLDLRSGLAYDVNNASTGIRSNLINSNINWTNNNPNRFVYLGGFDTVTLDSEITSSNFQVFAKNINVNANIKANGFLQLNAASFDPATTIKGSYTTSGWQNLDGLMTISNAVTSLSATSFDFRSGVNAANRTGTGTYSTVARVDLTDILKPYQAVGAASPSAVTSLNLAGFQDVILPSSINTIASAGTYSVYARNIDGSGLTGKPINAYSLNLYAGSFTNTAGIFKYNVATVGRNGLGQGGDTNNFGTLMLPANFTLQSSQMSLMSGLSTTDGKTRADLSFNTISAYVDPSNPTKYTGVYSTDGKSTGVRPGGARVLTLHGFNNLTLPTNSSLTGVDQNALNYELIDIGANNIEVRSDINAGQGSWWPSPYYLYLQAGVYNASTGRTGGTNAGALTFKSGIVLRDSNLTLNGVYGWASGVYGFNSAMTLINGATAADFAGVKLGYTKYDYTAGATGAYLPGSTGLASYQNLIITGFDNTDIQMENANDVLRIRGGGGVSITQRSNSTGTISIHNDLDALGSGAISLDAGNGGIRMGSNVGIASTVSVSAGKNSAININAETLNQTSRVAGQTIVANEANNVNVNTLSGAGNFEVNARGEISVVNNVNLTGTAALTLRADAQYGQTIADTDVTNTLVQQNLNTLFSANQLTSSDASAGNVGGDGLGSIVVNTAQPTIVTPIFRQVVVADAGNFTVTAANTYFKPDGSAYAVSDVIPRGTIFMMANGATVPVTLDTVVASGNPIRSTALVTQGGWTVNAANTYFNASNVAYANGAAIPTGTTIYFKPAATKPTGNITLGNNVGGQQLYVVTSYAASNSTPSVANYTSLGTASTASYSYKNAYNLPVSGSLAASSTKLSTDTPVDASIATNYYGNPESGKNSTLNLSGQFYTLNSTQAAPTIANKLYVGKSTSGNGWDTGWGTATLTTAGGELKLFSGPKHAIAGPGYAIGDAADLSIFSNATTNDFSASKAVRSGAIKLTSGTGNLVALGFRDVTVEASGVLSSSGNVTLGASRDTKFNTDVTLGGASKLATLIAGGTITNNNSGTYNTISTNAGGNLMLIAGGGVDVQTNVTTIAGSLQDNPNMTGALAGGITPTGIFKVQGKNGLVVGGTLNNAAVTDVTLDGTAGILYAATTPLSRTGISTKSISVGTGAIASRYGSVSLTAQTGDVTINQAIDSSATGGEINIKSTAGNVAQNADIKTSDNVIIQAALAITRSAGAISGAGLALTAGTTIGTSANRIQTRADTIAMQSAGDAYVTEADALTLAAITTNNGRVDVATTAGSITVDSVNLAPAITNNASGLNLTGISANGTGAAVLQANGSTSDVTINQALASGSGEVNLKAAQNITEAANISTAGNVFVEAGSSITRSAGTISGVGLALTAGTTIGTSANRIQTSADTIAMQSAGDAYLTEADAVTLAAKSTSNGRIDLATMNGTLNVDTVSLSSSVNANAGGLNLTGITANGTGAAVLLANGTTSDMVINQEVKSNSGEVNLKAGQNIIESANISTTGNVFVEAESAITQSAGSISGAGVALTAGTTIGTSANRIQTSANTIAMQSASDAYVTEVDAVTVAAKTNSNGRIDFATTAGTLTVDTVTLTTSLGNAAGLNLTGVSANGTGAAVLQANGASSDLVINQDVKSTSGEVNIKAAQNITESANISTTGNVFLEATQTITQTAGSINGAGLALTAGTTIGTSANRIQTSADTIAMQSAGDAYLTEADAVTVAAKTNSNGRIDVGTTAGTITVDTVSLTPTVTNNAAGLNLTGVSADGTGAAVLQVNGASSNLAINQAVSSGSGEVNLKAGQNITEASNVSTTGNVFVEAGSAISRSAGSINGAGVTLTAGTTIGTSANRIQTRADTIAMQSAGDAYLTEADAVTVAAKTNSNGRIDVGTTAGTITVDTVSLTPTVTNNAGGLNLKGVSADGTGAAVLLANGTTSDMVINQEVKSNSGEVNLKAGQNIIESANISTTGNVFVEAAQAITQTAGTISGAGLALTAGTTIGTSANRIQTRADTIAMQSAGDAYVTEADALTLAAITTNNGRVDVATTAGSITVDSVNLAPAITNNASGLNLTGISANGTGAAVLQANGSTSDVTINQALASGSGEVNLKAAQNITEAANISTAGNVFVEAGSSITRSAGTISGVGLALTAGTTIGTSANRIQTSADTIAMQSAGDAYLTEADAVTLAAKSTSNGRIDLATMNGTLNVDTVSLSSSVNANAGGLNLTGITANGTGAAVLLANGSTSDMVINQEVKSNSGEVNLKAGQNIIESANISTTGNVFVEAESAITQSAGSISGAGVALTAGTTIGTSANRIQTSANTIAMQSASDAYVTEVDAVTVAAKTNSNGRIDFATTAGTFTVDNVNLAPVGTNNAAGINLTGISANGTGAISLKADGTGESLNIITDITSTSGDISVQANTDMNFNGGQLNTTGDAFVSTDFGNVVNTQQSNSIQIVANQVTFSVGKNVGTGVIENGITGSNNLDDINLDVQSVSVSRGADIVLRNQGATQLGNISTTGYFGINAGGPISQITATQLNIGGDSEYDTTRDTTKGSVKLSTNAELNLGNNSFVNGDLTAASETSTVSLASGYTFNINGDLTVNGTANINGNIQASGKTGTISNGAGAVVATLTVNGNIATVTAYGDNVNFDINQVLNASVLDELPSNVTTIEINLANTSISFTLPSKKLDAIVLANNNNLVAGDLVVRTGLLDPLDPIVYRQTYHLTDTKGGLNFGNKNVVVNAALGTDFIAGNQSSNISAAKKLGVDSALGSNVNFTQSATAGSWTVRDAYDVKIASPSDIKVAYIKANRDVSISAMGDLTVTDLNAGRDALLLASPSALNDLSIDGNVRAGQHMLAVAGRDLTLAQSANVSAAQRLTFAADENAGTQAGTGWFRNNGATIQSDIGDVAIYAVAGGAAPAGYTGVASKIILGNLPGLTENQLIDHWNVNFQTDSGGSTAWQGFSASAGYQAGAGRFGSPMLWYKTMLTLEPVPPVPPVPIETPVLQMTQMGGVVSLYPVSFGMGLGYNATCKGWPQSSVGSFTVFSVLKPTFLGLRNAKTDTKEALVNDQGMVNEQSMVNKIDGSLSSCDFSDAVKLAEK
jgi:filamentous hemagglutinin family protein